MRKSLLRQMRHQEEEAACGCCLVDDRSNDPPGRSRLCQRLEFVNENKLPLPVCKHGNERPKHLLEAPGLPRYPLPEEVNRHRRCLCLLRWNRQSEECHYVYCCHRVEQGRLSPAVCTRKHDGVPGLRQPDGRRLADRVAHRLRPGPSRKFFPDEEGVSPAEEAYATGSHIWDGEGVLLRRGGHRQNPVQEDCPLDQVVHHIHVRPQSPFGLLDPGPQLLFLPPPL